MMGRGPMQPGTWPGCGSPTQTLARLPPSSATGDFAAVVGIVVAGIIAHSMLYSCVKPVVQEHIPQAHQEVTRQSVLYNARPGECYGN